MIYVDKLFVAWWNIASFSESPLLIFMAVWNDSFYTHSFFTFFLGTETSCSPDDKDTSKNRQTYFFHIICRHVYFHDLRGICLHAEGYLVQPWIRNASWPFSSFLSSVQKAIMRRNKGHTKGTDWVTTKPPTAVLSVLFRFVCVNVSFTKQADSHGDESLACLCLWVPNILHSLSLRTAYSSSFR